MEIDLLRTYTICTFTDLNQIHQILARLESKIKSKAIIFYKSHFWNPTEKSHFLFTKSGILSFWEILLLKNPLLLNQKGVFKWVFKSGICRKLWPKCHLIALIALYTCFIFRKLLCNSIEPSFIFPKMLCSFCRFKTFSWKKQLTPLRIVGRGWKARINGIDFCKIFFLFHKKTGTSCLSSMYDL